MGFSSDLEIVFLTIDRGGQFVKSHLRRRLGQILDLPLLVSTATTRISGQCGAQQLMGQEAVSDFLRLHLLSVYVQKPLEAFYRGHLGGCGANCRQGCSGPQVMVFYKVALCRGGGVTTISNGKESPLPCSEHTPRTR